MHLEQGAIIALASILGGMIWRHAIYAAKVDILFNFWEKKMERRSLQDEQASEKRKT